VEFIRATIVIVLLLSLSLCSLAQESEARDVSRSPGSDQTERLRVLFIGNSYTYFNNLPQLVSELAHSARDTKPVETEMVVVGGATLKRLWEGGKALETLKRARWNYVVLQEQSTLGPAPIVDGVVQISNPKNFHDYVRLFDAEIKKVGAKTILFLTWARHNHLEQQTVLTNAYQAIAKELKATIAPVGVAWENALKENPQLALHQPDKSHPTEAGSYLAACVIYATIYGKSPEGLTRRITGDGLDFSGRPIGSHNIGQENGQSNGQGDGKIELVWLPWSDASLLQRIAWRTVTQMSK
jgi:hypothetical protein